MGKVSLFTANRLTLAWMFLALPAVSLSQTSVRRVQLLPSKDAVEIEVEASDRVVPETRVLTGPDRLVVDFPNAVPGTQLRSQSVNRGEVKDLRVGLFQARPPVTRVVLDLKTAQSFQVFPNGRTVIIKVTGSAPQSDASMEDFPATAPTRPGLVSANYTASAERIRVEPPAKPLEVTFRDGMLGIRANKATLSEVLYAVQQKTGAEIAIAAGAEQEKVIADIPPAPAAVALARLLNGSKFNFLILNAANDPRQLDRVILTPRPEGVVMPVAPARTDDDDDSTPPPPAPGQIQQGIAPPPVPPPPRPLESKPATDDNNPD